jgi:importin subunit alpha-1
LVSKLVELIQHKSYNVVIPALRTLGNIATGDDLQTQKLLNAGALPALFAILSHDKKGIRKEACWTISKITAANVSQIQRALDHLADLMKNGDLEVVKEAA